MLKKFAQNNNQLVRKISLIDDSREEILKKFRNNTDPATIEKVYNYFHEGFEEQATPNPDKVALIASDCTLTYDEFDAAAKRFENALIARRVQRQSRIALLLPGTSREIISMLGVVKAGCALFPATRNILKNVSIRFRKIQPRPTLS